MKKIVLVLSLLFIQMLSMAQSFTDSNLPIVIIDTDGGVPIPDEPKVLGNMKIIWHQDGSRNYMSDANNPEFLNYDGRIGIELRGSSSQMPDKKPYGFETLMDDDITNNNVSLLGMPKENDWILNSLAFDQTGMRDFLSYELSEKLGQYAPRRVYCEVVINGQYNGLYVFLEKIKADDGRVNIEKDGGYITKADKTTGDDPVAWRMIEHGSTGWWPSYVDFIHHYPKPDDITPSQHNYIKSVFLDLDEKAADHNTSITDGIPAIIDIPSFVDFMMIAEFASNVDVYTYSTFFHKDRNGKLRAGPVWDYNLAYGYDEFGYRSRYDVWQFNNQDNNGPEFFNELFETPEFRCYFAKRWFELSSEGNMLDYNVLCSRIDEIDEWITEAIGRDNIRWHQMYQHDYYVEDMQEWILDRINWLNNNVGSYNDCDDIDLPPLVISRIHYHPADLDSINGNRLEFIQINNNSDEDVDLTGLYLRELGVTYTFPADTHLAARDSLVLCSDSAAYVDFYHHTPFGEYDRKLSNKDENIVLADAWGNVIDEVHYFDSEPWPTEPDGLGPYLQLIDLDADNSLPENWIAAIYYDNSDDVSDDDFAVYPNPTNGVLHIKTDQNIIFVELFDLTGKSVARSNDTIIDVSNLPNGLFLLKINTEKGSSARMISVNNY
ncbi:MAG: CotH kinase family protein [Bacteroidales bacterium]|nr:CotH kinase family protein [Bacteroidales bacterium]